MSNDNSTKILEVAKKYYDNMQIIYDKAIKRDDSLQYFREKQKEYIKIKLRRILKNKS